jgi:hypothetical protein
MGERFGACVTYRIPGQLDDYGAEEERDPRVGPCGPFSCLIERALADEHGHCLLDEIAEYGEEDEDTHHLVEQATPRVLGIDLRQADEKSLQCHVSWGRGGGTVNKTDVKTFGDLLSLRSTRL